MLSDPFDRLQDRLDQRSRMLKERLRGPEDRLAERLGDTGQPKKPKNRPLTPEQEATLFGMLGHVALSGFESVGNLLDTTGAASRAALVGKNPLTAAINPDERVTGRDLLEHYGILGKNKEGFDPGDVAGFIAEMALDPMSYLTLGTSAAVTAAGKAAKAAGLTAKLTRGQALRTTVKDLLQQAGPEAMEKFAQATNGRSLPIDFLDQPVAGLMRVGVPNIPGMPFRGQGKALFTGARSQKFADKLDNIGEALRYGNIPGTNLSPGRLGAALFSAPNLGATSKIGQKLAQHKSETADALNFANREQTMRDAMTLFAHPNGYDPVQMRRWVEGVEPLPWNHPAYEVVHRMRNYLRNSAQDLNRVGAQNGIRQNYLARQLTTSTGPGPGGNDLTFSTGNASRIARHNAFNDLAEGTSTIQQVAKDPLVQQAIANGVDDKGVALLIKNLYGDPAGRHYVQPTYVAKLKSGAQQDRDRYLAFAKILKKATPDQLKAGYFGNDPMFDFLTKQSRDVDTATSAHAALEALTHHAAPVVGAAPAGTVRVGDVLRKLKLRTGLEGVPKQYWAQFDPTDKYANGSLFEIARRRGLNQVTPAMLDEVIPENIAKDLLKFHDRFTNPKALHPIIKGIDSLGSMFKAGVLTHPARYTRDFVGAQVQNMMHDMFSPQSVKAAWRIIRGGIPKGISENPKIAALLTERGLPVTDKTATQLIQQIAFAGNLTNPGSLSTSQIGGQIAQGPSSAAGMLSQLPGNQPFSFSRMSKKAAGGKLSSLAQKAASAITGKPVGWLPDTNWNPFNIHGVMDLKGNVRDVTNFGPVAAGADAGYLTDAMGRLPALIHLLQEGMDPAEAVVKVKAALVDYGSKALTQFERAVMTRLFPFYRFCVPPDHEILTRRGYKRYDEITIGEEVLAMDHRDGTLHWTPLLAVNVFPMKGRMLRYRQNDSSRSRVCFEFTEHHNWPVVTRGKPNNKTRRRDGKDRVGGLRVFRIGAELTPEQKLLKQGEFHQNDSIIPNRLAKILGWVVTDGYFRWRGGHCEMMVYQSPGKFLDEIIELLGTAPRRPHPETGVVCVPVALADTKEITRFFKTKKDLLSIVCNLSRSAAEDMRDAMFKAEGSTLADYHDRQHFSQCREKNPAVLEAFQILLTLTGSSGTVHKEGCRISTCDGYMVRDFIKPFHYDGIVWCPTTALGTWVMRHDGHVVITGNSRGMLPSVVKELIEHPGGKTAQFIRATNRAHEKDAIVPEQMNGPHIPLSPGESGEDRAITSLGLMPEDPLGFFGQGVKGAGMEALSRLNPLLKGPMEYFTGRSFFQHGPHGGRPLEDMDPLLGRTLANLTGRDEPYHLPLGSILEPALANSPLSRVLSSTRTASDTRKDVGTRLMNLLTGVKITDVPERVRLAILRDRAQARLHGMPGAKEFTDVYIRPEDLARLTPEQQQEVLYLRAALAQISRKNKAAKAAAAAA